MVNSCIQSVVRRFAGPLLVVIIGLHVVVPGSSACAAEPKADVRALVDGDNAFALDLYARLAGDKGNLFFSPYSISSALAMTCAARAVRPRRK